MDTSMLSQISALQRMSLSELRDQWMKLYGEPTRSRNKQFLFRRLAWRIQELQHGGLSDHARQRIEQLAPDTFERARPPAQALPVADVAPVEGKPRSRRDPRLPAPGTVLVRQYRGRELRLIVHDDHFELDGQAFKSLTEAARHVTGSHWNGKLFWGLSKRKRG